MPDLTTLGKAIANGFPIAAVAGRRELMERFNTNPAGDVHFGGTYNGNAVGRRGRRWPRSSELEDGDVARSTSSRSGERMRGGLRDDRRRAPASRPSSAATARCSSCASWTARSRPTTTCCATTTRCSGATGASSIARGVFEMPESLGRSHISASHTEDDVDRSLAAAEEALAAALDATARPRGVA